MSFQSGVCYFDGRPISSADKAECSAATSYGDTTPTAHWSQGGILMAQADPFADSPQPPSTSASAVITFDGRIHNREELGSFADPCLGDAASDASLAFSVYAKDGIEGFARLVGDFSFVIWDRSSKQVVFASDFAGVRPLYYFADARHIRWSTRLKALVRYAPSEEIDDEYAAGLLAQGGCPHRTPYRGIYSVPPGHAVVASTAGLKILAFWTPPVANSVRYSRESDYDDRLRELFQEAVRCRLRSPSPALCELSGGLDSSSIVCMARQLRDEGALVCPELVTLSYEHENSRDDHFRDLVEQDCGFAKHHLSTAQFRFLGEMHAGDAAPVFWEQLHRAIANVARERKATTLMTGLLGDLVMFNFWDDSAQVWRLFRTGRWRAGMAESFKWSMALRIPIWHVLGNAMLAASPLSRGYSAWQNPSGGLRAAKPEDSITPAFRARMNLDSKDRFLSPRWRQAPHERRLHFRGLIEAIELRRLQPPEPLQHLAYTHPYSHRPLVHFMLSVPPEVTCGPGEPRRLMRRAFAGILPPQLRQRRSKDYFGAVFLESLRPLAEALLSQRSPLEVVERGYVDPSSLRDRLHRLTHAVGCNEPQLRQIILLELWLKNRGRRRLSETAA